MKLPEGSLDCPSSLYPQQVMEPLVLNPQLCSSPTETALKLPEGALTCPSSSFPQQVMVPLVLNPQLCFPPAETSW